MQISIFGAVIILIGVLLLILKPQWILWVSIVFLPINTGILIIFPNISFNLKIFEFFSILLIIHFLFKCLINKRFFFPNSRKLGFLASYFFFSVLSLIMPIILENQVMIHPINAPANPIITNPISFSYSNITQLAYVLFSILFFMALVNNFTKYEKIEKAIKLYTYSVIFVLFTGILGIFLRIFNFNSLFLNLAPFLFEGGGSSIHQISGGIPLMFTAFGEPGDSGIVFSSIFGFIIAYTLIKTNNNFFTRKIDYFLLTLIFLNILLGGTAGLLGLASILIFIIIVSFYKNFNISYKKIIGISISLVIVIFLANIFMGVLTKGSLIKHINEWHRARLLEHGGSYLLRREYAIDGLKLFIKYPLLGVGIGSNQGKSLIIYLLSNVGILGTLSFFLFCFSNVQEISSNDSQLISNNIIPEALILGFIGVFVGIMITGGWGVRTTNIMWFILALIYSYTNLYGNRKRYMDYRRISE